jgi:hypothetical protein
LLLLLLQALLLLELLLVLLLLLIVVMDAVRDTGARETQDSGAADADAHHLASRQRVMRLLLRVLSLREPWLARLALSKALLTRLALREALLRRAALAAQEGAGNRRIARVRNGLLHKVAVRGQRLGRLAPQLRPHARVQVLPE